MGRCLLFLEHHLLSLLRNIHLEESNLSHFFLFYIPLVFREILDSNNNLRILSFNSDTYILPDSIVSITLVLLCISFLFFWDSVVKFKFFFFKYKNCLKNSFSRLLSLLKKFHQWNTIIIHQQIIGSCSCASFQLPLLILFT